MARPIDPMMKSKDKKVVKGEKREWEMEKSWSTFNREGWG
jgi:hypothetical protein